MNKFKKVKGQNGSAYMISFRVEGAFKDAAKNDVRKKERVDHWFSAKLADTMKLYDYEEESA